jgi:hypothetical protein
MPVSPAFAGAGLHRDDDGVAAACEAKIRVRLQPIMRPLLLGLPS